MISLIAAVAENGVIGSKNALPWYIPEDLKHFKQITTGKTVLMGRNTYDSIIRRLGKPLPDRKSIVISKSSDLHVANGIKVYSDIGSAIESSKDEPEVMVIGGGQIYNQMIDYADRLYITEVHKQVEGDTMFPEIDKSIWSETSREDHQEFSFVTYERTT